MGINVDRSVSFHKRWKIEKVSVVLSRRSWRPRPFFTRRPRRRRPRHGEDNQCRESREERGSKIEVMSPWRLLMDDTTGRAFEMKRRVYEGNDLNTTAAGHTFATLIAPTCNDGIKRYAARIMTKVLATDSSPAMAATCLELPVLRIFVDDPCHTLPTRRFYLLRRYRHSFLDSRIFASRLKEKKKKDTENNSRYIRLKKKKNTS